MACRHSVDTVIEGADLVIPIVFRDEVVEDPGFIQTGFDQPGGQQPLDLGGKPEPAFTGAIVKMAGTRRIPCPEQTLLPAIPDEKNELADDPVGRFFTPCFIGPQHQFGIGLVTQDGALCEQVVTQFVTVVDPAVHDEDEACIFIGVRLMFGKRLGRRAEHAVAQCNMAALPMFDGIRAAMHHGGGHLCDQTGFEWGSVETDDAGNSRSREDFRKNRLTEGGVRRQPRDDH